MQDKLDRWLAERQTHRVKLIEQEREEQARRRALDQRSPKKDNFIAAWFRQRRRDKELGVGRAVARLNRERALDAQMGPKPVPPKAPEGVYLYGSVGCGKSGCGMSQPSSLLDEEMGIMRPASRSEVLIERRPST
jgi:predicted ATPase